MTNPQADAAEYREVMLNPIAIDAIRARQRDSYGAVPRIPLYCSGHKTGMAIILGVRKGTGSSVPLLSTRTMRAAEGIHVQDHLIMYPAHDDDAAASRARADPPQPIDWAQTTPEQKFPWGDDASASHAILCGTCGHVVRRRKVWLLKAAIERVITSGKKPYRISIT